MNHQKTCFENKPCMMKIPQQRSFTFKDFYQKYHRLFRLLLILNVWTKQLLTQNKVRKTRATIEEKQVSWVWTRYPELKRLSKAWLPTLRWRKLRDSLCANYFAFRKESEEGFQKNFQKMGLNKLKKKHLMTLNCFNLYFDH